MANSPPAADPAAGRLPAARHPFRVAFEGGDRERLADVIAPDVVLHSPITSSFRFVGREEVADLLAVVRELFEDLSYTAEFGAGDDYVTVFQALVGDRRLEGTDILRLDPEGRVREITVFIRPLAGLAALTAALAPRLARDSGRGRALAAAMITAPLAAITRLGDAPVSGLARGTAWGEGARRPAPSG
jgi:SnoaL-like domain